MINLPRSLRHDRLPENRHTELEEWSRDLQDPGWRDAFTLRVLDELVRTRTGEAMESRTESLRLHGEIEAHQQTSARLRTSVQTRQQHIGRLRDVLRARDLRISELESDLADERRRVQHLQHTVEAI